MGLGLIFVSVLLNIFGLAWIRSVSTNPYESTSILYPSYFISGLLMIAYHFLQHKGVCFSWKKNILSFFWGILIACIYYIYLFHPQELTLSQIIIAQCISPITSVFISGDWRKNSLQIITLEFSPLLLLFPIAFIESEDFLSRGIIYFLSVTLLFTFSQSISRYIAKTQSESSFAQGIGFFSICLSLGLYLFCTAQTPENFIPYPTKSIEFGILVFLIQALFLEGLRKAPPGLSATVTSSSVPIALFIRQFSSQSPLNTINIISIILGILYFVFILAISHYKKRNFK